VLRECGLIVVVVVGSGDTGLDRPGVSLKGPSVLWLEQRLLNILGRTHDTASGCDGDRRSRSDRDMNRGCSLGSLGAQVREHHTRAIDRGSASAESRQLETVVARSHGESLVLFQGSTELDGLAIDGSFSTLVPQ
jgi:hypothetical protein